MPTTHSTTTSDLPRAKCSGGVAGSPTASDTGCITPMPTRFSEEASGDAPAVAAVPLERGREPGIGPRCMALSLAGRKHCHWQK